MTFARLVVTAALLIGVPAPVQAQTYVEEELRVPMAAAGPRGLEALLVRPSGTDRYPLALLSHGSPRAASARPDMSPWAMLPQAIEFARRGFAAVVLMRRGYGGSGGSWAETYGGCANADYVAAGTAAAADLKAAIPPLGKRPDIDVSRMIAVGVSAGGFATVALTAEAPPGLVAAISFAGGRGSDREDDVCRPERLVEAFRVFGGRSRTPMLWVYAQNDHFFGPKLAQKMRQAFAAGGGKVDFVDAPPFGSDGHSLFSASGIPEWTGMIDAFLRQEGLTVRTTLLPSPPRPPLSAPRALSANGRKAFESYLMSGPHKAFALGPDGHFGWQSGQRTIDGAKSGALQYCRENGDGCTVMFVDDAALSEGAPD